MRGFLWVRWAKRCRQWCKWWRLVLLAAVAESCFSQTGTVRDAVQVVVEGKGTVRFLNATCKNFCRFYHERTGTGTFGVDHIHLFIAEPAPGWAFLHWEVDCGGSTKMIRVSIFRDMLCKAIFVPSQNHEKAAPPSTVGAEPSG